MPSGFGVSKSIVEPGVLKKKIFSPKMSSVQHTAQRSEEGNTNVPPPPDASASQKRKRNFCFTTNQKAEPVQFDSTSMKYMVKGKEVGESGNPHEQGFVIFKSAKTLSAVIKAFPGTHWEYTKKKIQQAADYCKKDGDFTEWGEAPKGQGARTDLIRLGDLVRGGHTDEDILQFEDDSGRDYAGMWIRNYRGIRAAREQLFPGVKRNWEMDVRIYWGEPGSGKTRAVYDEFGYDGAIFPKQPGKWWCGYEGQEVVLIDDFDPANCFDMQFDFYLKLLDRYPLIVQVKGGNVDFRSKTIIFTTNFDPDYWFSGKRNRKAFFRRITSIREFKKEQVDTESI